jgi:hypothetical protein
MNGALYGNVKYPPRGFSGLNNKPLWMCGEKPWKWYTKEMNDPSITPTKPLYLSRPETFEAATGAWYYKQRFVINGKSDGVEICRPDIFATTLASYDFITFCDFFSDHVFKTESPVDGKDGVVKGETHLDDFQDSGSRIMFHELVHWFGAEIEKDISGKKVKIKKRK